MSVCGKGIDSHVEAAINRNIRKLGIKGGIALKISRSMLSDRAKNRHVSYTEFSQQRQTFAPEEEQVLLELVQAESAGKSPQELCARAHKISGKTIGKKNGTRSLRSVIKKSLKPALLNSIQNALKTSTKPVSVTFMKNTREHIFVLMVRVLLCFLPFTYELLI